MPCATSVSCLSCTVLLLATRVWYMLCPYLVRFIPDCHSLMNDGSIRSRARACLCCSSTLEIEWFWKNGLSIWFGKQSSIPTRSHVPPCWQTLYCPIALSTKSNYDCCFVFCSICFLCLGRFSFLKGGAVPPLIRFRKETSHGGLPFSLNIIEPILWHPL